MKKDRTKTVLIRLTEEEKNKLQEMAEENRAFCQEDDIFK